MNIIVPLGGLGDRFKKEGYTSPKPLINVVGKPMLQHVLDNLNIHEKDTVWIIYNTELDNYMFQQRISCSFPIKYVQIKNQTRGAAETLLIGLNEMSVSDKNKPVIAVDCDNFYTCDILDDYRNNLKKCGNAVFSFLDYSESPVYSYVKVNSGNYITEIREKEKISDLANTGCYCFETGTVLKTYCEKIIEKDVREKNEFYISCVIKQMIEEDNPITSIVISKSDFHCLGTPFHLKLFSSEQHKFMKPMRFCFDLDKCLVSKPLVEGDYSTVAPIQRNIEYLRFLKDLGHTVIIHTARRMKTHKGNVGAVIADIGLTTLTQLKQFDIVYDEIYFGKPYSDFYIDDLAVNSYNDLEKELGFYMPRKKERYFNSVEETRLTVYTKRSDDIKKISGEINWYKNVPNGVEHLFPKLFNYTTGSYQLEQINGVTFSEMYSSGSLSIAGLGKLLDSIKKIHKTSSSTSHPDTSIYVNYSSKLKKRYNDNLEFYSKFKNSKELYHKILTGLDEYESKDLGKLSVIHGDPVFTNIILDEVGEIKLIDMRGLLGDEVTIWGDSNYDYGKIYQSLIGYDEIINSKRVNSVYRDKMIKKFNEHADIDTNVCKLIANSLLFSMLPLHSDDISRCKQYYELIDL